MSQDTVTTTSTEISFGDAYDQLKQITEKLNGEEVEADQLVGLLKRGKGLEAALRDHLSSIEQQVTAIESGEGVDSFRIVATGGASADEPADVSDFGDPKPAPQAGGDGDDIPF